MTPYTGTLESNLLAFAKHLRAAEMLVGPQEVSLGLRALESIDLAQRDDARTALRTVFATNPLEQRIFNRLFEHYFAGGLLQADDDVMPTLNAPPKPKRLESLSMLDWDQGAESDETVDTFAYSPQEVEAQEDSPIRTEEIDKLGKLVRRLNQKLATKPSRRWESVTTKGNVTDLRRTIRHSLSRGGEMLDLQYKRRRLGKTDIVFVFDVSGSMMVYSHFLLQLAYAFVRERQLGKAEVFGFSTDLYRLTSHLQRGGVKEAIAAAREAMPGRSGGTKIGQSLEALLERYGALIDSKTVLIINSDGWDTGDLDALRRSMRTLHERANRIIWLNPLAASTGYEPTASGMQTALPYIDTFAPSHNLESLQNLENRLGKTRR